MAKEVILENSQGMKGFSVLVIEDNTLSLKETVTALEKAGAEVFNVPDSAHAAGLLLHERIDVIIGTLDLVDEQCIEVIKNYKARMPKALFYVLTGQEYDSVEISQESVRLVIDDYIKKPLDVDRFAGMIAASIGRPDGDKSLAVADPLVRKVKPYFLFRSPVMRRTLADLPQISMSDQTVLITGDTGTGKEIIARAIHVLSSRASGPFVPINCGAIPESLIEGELFGHEKGAFTGAVKTRRGKFETAHNGTLFLDEIGDMPLNLQVRLLRVLEEGQIHRIGSEAPVSINVRVIGASNIDLKKAVDDGLFRDDLYYRINVLRLELPPLNKRIEDISLLAVHFLERAFAEMGRLKPYPSLSSETIYILEQCPWKGNVRELRNVMTRVATLLPGDTNQIFPFHILPHLDRTDKVPVNSSNKKEAEGVFIWSGTNLKEVEEMLINKTLKTTGGNRTQAAKLLGISLRTLRRKLNK
ncbi:MAG TPA: sigma-54-dependent Fis family transcriptional regulator [Nitrospirae bacterium]|nr:transcriptional regulatory protein ZraR [bacterium BMS3Abin09]GBE40278.1 transcriptional regulatory protein ZraR [bacterium BMS3Bbin09]HDN95005.1 sigma-54-dependent Fis family transcriptional regulator [Nitrospirota bacterium]HDZ84565.1 sigma-54-dependent Fis family transcriptional regulator [Nitrospirota bacterium]